MLLNLLFLFHSFNVNCHAVPAVANSAAHQVCTIQFKEKIAHPEYITFVMEVNKDNTAPASLSWQVQADAQNRMDINLPIDNVITSVVFRGKSVKAKLK